MSDRSIPLYSALPTWKGRLWLIPWLFLAILTLAYSNLGHQQDFAMYVSGGHAVMAGADIYKDSPYNVMPPLFSLVCVPLALLSDTSSYLALTVWLVLNILTLILIFDLLARVVYGRSLSLHGGGTSMSLAEPGLFVPILLTMPYIIENFRMHQINLIILLLVLGGLYLQQTDRAMMGGAAIGVAAALKVMPLLFVPYLAWRRRWRAAWAAAAATAIFSVSPAIFFGWGRFWTYAFSWFRIAGGARFHPGGANQSVLAMWDRIIGRKLIPFFAPGLNPVPWSGNPWVRVAWALTIAALGLAMLFAFRNAPLNSEQRANEWSVIYLISTIFGPVSWIHYLVAMLLPNVLLYKVWSSPGATSKARQISGAVLLICIIPAFVIGHLVDGLTSLRLLSGSPFTYAVLIMLAALLWMRRQPVLPDRI